MAAWDPQRCLVRQWGLWGLAWVFSTLAGECQVNDNIIPLVPPNTSIPGIISETPGYNSVEIATPAFGTVSPVAATSGVSTPSGISAPIFSNPGLISRTVTFNPFQPPDLITASIPANLPPLRTTDLWNISASANSSLNSDSNITRSSSAHLSDGYLHAGGGLDLRWGTNTEPLAFDLSYNYSADLFERQTQFDTYTHDFAFSSRIGRSTFVLVPYAVGQFRTVGNQGALDSGRQSYNFLLEGVHGEYCYFPDLVHDYDFSHTGVTYSQRGGANFEVWDLSQQLDYTIESKSTQREIQSLRLYPLLEVKETSRSVAAPVDEINGGVGGSISLAQNVTMAAQVGWGDVSSADRTVNYDSYSGLRYDASLVYQPLRYLILTTEYRRILSFNPTVSSRDTDELDVSAESPLALGPHLTVTPAVGLFRAVSNDYTFPEDSLYIQPAFTVAYKFNDHFAAFGKVEYSTNIAHEYGTTSYTNDLQGSIGVNLLF